MKLSKFSLIILITLIFNQAYSQYTDVINSNRPGVSRSAFSVGTNVLQFEAGPYILKEKHTPLLNEVSGFGIDFAARYGLLLEQLEINIEGTYQNDTSTDNRSSIPAESTRSNFRNLTVGAKYLVYDPYKKAGEAKPNLYSWKANRQFKWNSLIPAVAVYLGANFDSDNNIFIPYVAPPNSKPYFEGGFSPKVMVATQNNFSGGWVFVMNYSLDRFTTDYSEFQYILTLTKSVSEQWAIFGEAQGISGDYYADNLFRLGGAYLWDQNFQLDTALTFNTKDTPSIFSVNFGASYRFDFHKDKEVDNNNSAKEEGERQARSRKGRKTKKSDKTPKDIPTENKKPKKKSQEIDFDN